MNSLDREKYILSLTAKVKYIANQLCSGLSLYQQVLMMDDFIQAGWVGAIKAVDDHDATKGSLGNYASWRIRGHILDFMRDCDFLSREHRNRVRKAEKEEDPTIQVPVTFSLHCGPEGRDLSIEDRRAFQDYGTINASETALSIMRRAGLLERHKKMLMEYYWNDQTMKQIGKKLDVNESRVSQIHKIALDKCRAAAV